MSDPKAVFEDVFSKAQTRALWTANYLPAIPFTPQDFDIGAILPAMLYMMRWGYRRGKGKFEEKFGHEVIDKKGRKKTEVHIGSVAKKLSESGSFQGFEEQQQLLGDLLLASCLENRDHDEGLDKPVQRIYPTHYMASWVDLPQSVSNLRGIPEMLVAILARQEKGVVLDATQSKGHYHLGGGFKENPLLRVFGRGMSIDSGVIQNDRANADQFVEVNANEIGIDELLTIRMAQACESAPQPAARTRGAESQHIPNQSPLPQGAMRLFRDDLTVLIEEYGGAVPRQAFLQLFEAAVSLNLTNILLSTLAMLLHWEEHGCLPKEQPPWPLFVDASNGQDKNLQAHSEACMADTMRRYERLPVLTMLLRVLDEQTGRIRGIELPPKEPNATAFINFLGEFLVETHPKSERLFDNIYSDCKNLDKALEENELTPEVVEHLRDKSLKEPLRFAESLVELMGKENQWKRYRMALESCLMSDRPSGLARKRHTRQTRDGKSSKVELRSIVLLPVMLDSLVHRHMHKAGKGNKSKPFLSLQDFLKILRTNYGLYIDQSPPGMVIPQEVLQTNTRWLERRLRDLGLLIGVNDAPSMKQLKPRYPSRQEADEVDA
ncbi:MAG: hypothetical protein PHQ05_13995 [Sterolibacterium sp.]|nr:hypothetical protein [Sterolibacterium sp.]